MAIKKILLVSNGFFPEISPRSFRATELAKEFVQQGHKVTVITKYRDHDYTDFLNEFPIVLKMWSRPRFPKLPDFKRKPFSVIIKAVSRTLSVLFEYPTIEEMFLVKGKLKHERGYELMISFAVPFPVHWGVALAYSQRNPISRIWIADCGDPYMFAQLDTFRKPFYFKYFELIFCQKCHFITIPFKEMENQFYKQFASKIKIIPQGFNFDEIKLYEGKRDFIKPVFVFAGSIIPGKRDLTLFMNYLKTLSLDYRFIIYTNQPEWFVEYKKILAEKLEINDYIDRLSLIYEMSKADFLVNVDTIYDSPGNTEAIPSKLIDYALSNRPILNINSAFLDKEVVLEFMQKNYAKQRVINKSNYNIKKVSEQFLELCN